MKLYHTVFGLANRLTVVSEGMTYSWRVTIRGHELPDYNSKTIPDADTVYAHFYNSLPSKTRSSAEMDLPSLRDSIKGSMRCLRRVSKKEKSSNCASNNPSG